MSSSRWRRPRLPAPEKPFRDELLSIERLEERALALAASFTVDPNPRRRARDIFPRFDDNVRVLRARLPHAGRRRPDRAVRHAGGRVAARQLPPGRVGDPRHPPATCPRAYYRAAADARLARARRPRAHLRDGRRADPPQRQPARSPAARSLFLNSYQRVAPLTIGELWAWPSMLKLALIENLRRLAEELLSARAARRAADALRVERRRRAAAPARCRPAPTPAFVVQLLHRVREYGLRLSAVRAAPWTTHLAAQQTTAEDAIRGEHQRQARGAGVGGQRHHQPAPLLDARLAASTSSRSAWSSRCCSAIRRASTAGWTSCSRDRAAAGGRGAGRRRAAKARCASR